VELATENEAGEEEKKILPVRDWFCESIECEDTDRNIER
jgi:hypothetical protein